MSTERQITQNRIVTRALLYDVNGRVLVGLRARGIGAGQWALLGGKPEPGEPLRACVQREVYEEAGLEFKPDLYRYTMDESHSALDPWHVFIYAGVYWGTFRLQTDEVSATLLVEPQSVSDIDFAFNHRDILKDFFLRQRYYLRRLTHLSTHNY